MTEDARFDLKDFLPYLLNQAAERTSLDFQHCYRDRYGMLRTEWRVVFHLGRYGEITAKEICDRSRLHKTKVSRAVAALEKKRFLVRTQSDDDRRHARLSLTDAGKAAYEDLSLEAQRYDRQMMVGFSKAEQEILRRCLTRIADI